MLRPCRVIHAKSFKRDEVDMPSLGGNYYISNPCIDVSSIQGLNFITWQRPDLRNVASSVCVEIEDTLTERGSRLKNVTRDGVG